MKEEINVYEVPHNEILVVQKIGADLADCPSMGRSLRSIAK